MGWLDPLNTIELVVGSVLADRDGLVVESVVQGPDFDPQAFAVGITAITREVGALSGDLHDRLRRHMIVMDRREVVIICFGSYLLGTVLRRESGRRDVRKELLRIASQISGELIEVGDGR